MSTIAYALRSEYAGTDTVTENGEDREVPRYLGGVIAVADDRDFNVGEALVNGDGTVVVEAEDADLIRALDEYTPLKRVPNKDGVEAHIDQYAGQPVDELKAELERRKLDTSGRKPDLVDRLRANDRAVATGDQDAAADPKPDAAVTGQEG